VAPAPREAVQRWRLVLAREPLDADAGQREQLASWDDALRRSGLPAAGLDADPPRPRFAMAAPLGATMRGEAELVDIWLTDRLPAWRVREAVGRSVPAGFDLLETYDVWLGEAALPGQVVASVYRTRVADDAGPAERLHDACRALLDEPSIVRERMKGTGPVRYDLRPFIEALEVTASAPAGPIEIVMMLRHDPERGVGRPDEVLSAIADWLGLESLPVAAIVRERLVLAPPHVAPPPRPRGPRRGGQGAPTAPASRARK
jgi:radical SAM-linked protein